MTWSGKNAFFYFLPHNASVFFSFSWNNCSLNLQFVMPSMPPLIRDGAHFCSLTKCFSLSCQRIEQREDYAACIPSKASKSILFSLKTQPAAKYLPLLLFRATNSTRNKNEGYSNFLIFNSNVNSQSCFFEQVRISCNPRGAVCPKQLISFTSCLPS